MADVPDLADALAETHTYPTPEDPERERWQITNDGQAAWALRKLARFEAELARLKDQADDEVDRIKTWLADATAGAAREAEFFRGHLTRYYESLDPETRPRTYRLPTGKIAARKRPDGIDVTDEDAFIDWAIAYDERDLLRISPSVSAIKQAVETGPPSDDLPDGTLYAVLPPNAGPGTYPIVITPYGEVVAGIMYRVGDDAITPTPEGTTR